jgi:transcriptional regulator with XRE-family HTH domain
MRRPAPRNQQEAASLSTELSIQQETALHALMSGATQAEAAERAGVARETVWRWLQDDAEFVAALNRIRKGLAEATIDRLRLARFEAIEVLVQLLKCDDPRLRLLAAQTVLRATAPEEVITPTGPTDASDVLRAQRSIAQQREVAEMLANL